MLDKLRIIAVVGALALASAAPAQAHKRPLFWTIAGGTQLPTDPHIPLVDTHCHDGICIGKLGKIDGHSAQWLIGRDPVWGLFHQKAAR